MSILSLLSLFASAELRGSGLLRAREMRDHMDASDCEHGGCDATAHADQHSQEQERNRAVGALTQTDVLMLTDFTPVSFLSDRCRS